MRLESPGGTCNKKREEGQWLVPGCLGVGDWRGNELAKRCSSL